MALSIYTLSDLRVLSNMIGSLSLANEHYSPPTEWIMRKPNKNKMAGVNSRFASVFESEILKIQEDAVPESTGLSAIQPNTSRDIQIVQENIQFSTQSCERYNFWWILRQLLFQFSFQVNFKTFDWMVTIFCKHIFDSHWFERCLRTIILDCHEVFSKINYRFSMFKDSVNSFANSRMLCTACTFSTHELRGQLNRFLMVSFWKCCWDHFLCIY